MPSPVREEARIFAVADFQLFPDLCLGKYSALKDRTRIRKIFPFAKNVQVSLT